MPRLKTTVSIDEATLHAACELLGRTSTSEVVDIALARLVETQRLLNDIRGYLAAPPTTEELMLAHIPVSFDLDDDDIDYDQFYAAHG